MIGGEACVGERHGRDRVEVADRDQVAGGVDDQVFGDGAGRAEAGWEDAEFGGAGTVVLGALGAEPAGAAPPWAVDDDRLPHVEPGDAGAEGGDGACAFVAEGERQREGQGFGGQGHDEVVGMADPGRGDFQQDLAWAWFGGGDLADFRFGTDRRVLESLHRTSSVRCWLFPRSHVRPASVWQIAGVGCVSRRGRRSLACGTPTVSRSARRDRCRVRRPWGCSAGWRRCGL